ncbi:hypothetical protein [Comamonas thiooxydans]|nr:hypothetical protein [Comamonas thiooxydans]
MRVYFKDKSGKVSKFDVKTDDHAAAIDTVKAYLGAKSAGVILARVK